MSDELPLCKAAGLEIEHNTGRGGGPCGAIISAADVEAYLRDRCPYIPPDGWNKPKEPAVSDGFFKPSDFDGALTATEKNSKDNCAAFANRLLRERGTVVYGWDHKAGIYKATDKVKHDQDFTWQAIMLPPQPIVRDSCEQLVRDLANHAKFMQGDQQWAMSAAWVERARALLSKTETKGGN